VELGTFDPRAWVADGALFNVLLTLKIGDLVAVFQTVRFATVYPAERKLSVLIALAG
jgi:hypothetical protein